MKLSLCSYLYWRSTSTYQNLVKSFLNFTTPTLNSSTIARSVSLYKRISPLGDYEGSIVPVLDQWVQEGRSVNKELLQGVIKELKSHKRFQHALEVEITLRPPLPMKLSLCSYLYWRSTSTYQNLVKSFLNSTTPTLNSSTIARSVSLYERISPLGDHEGSIVPVLDQWVQEGRSVNKELLQGVIKELKSHKRFQHALEICQWMSDKKFIPLSHADVATRLRLIFRVHGLEQVEMYFNNLPQQLRGFVVYASLLNCYADERSEEKAEAVVQKLRDMGFDRIPFCYNMLLNLYYRLGSREKLDSLIHEMEGCYDDHTFPICLRAYASNSDSDGIDRIVDKMESDPRVIVKSDTYAIAADGYLKVGQLNRALEMLKKAEGHIATLKRKDTIFPILLTLYTKAGNREELYRIWNLYKENVNINNRGYITMLSSLSKFNDIEGAEKIFKECESRGLSDDFRIINFLISAYIGNGHLGKAEGLVHYGIRRGGNPNVITWYCLTAGYILDNQVSKAAEALRKAILVFSPWSNLSKDTLVTCLEFLEGNGDVDRAEEFISLLKPDSIFSAVVLNKLVNLIKDRK